MKAINETIANAIVCHSDKNYLQQICNKITSKKKQKKGENRAKTILNKNNQRIIYLITR